MSLQSVVPEREAPINADSIIKGLEELRPVIYAARARIDEECRIPEDILAALRELGVFKVLVPRDLGGLELGLSAALRIWETAANIDGSVGWICAIGGGTNVQASSWIARSGSERIFSNSNAVTAGHFAPNGIARAVEGGYRVTGRWSFCSGCTHSDWFMGGCFVEVNGSVVRDADGKPRTVMPFVPQAEAEILPNWQTLGLRGTGSHDYKIDDVFVPDEMVFEPTKCPVPYWSFIPLVFATVPLGMARRAVDELIAMAPKKIAMGSLLRDTSYAASQVAAAEGALRAARLAAYAAASTMERLLRTKAIPSKEQPALSVVTIVHAYQTALEVTRDMFELAGSAAIRDGNPIGRALRDLQTAGAHQQFSNPFLESAGKTLLGSAGGHREVAEGFRIPEWT